MLLLAGPEITLPRSVLRAAAGQTVLTSWPAVVVAVLVALLGSLACFHHWRRRQVRRRLSDVGTAFGVLCLWLGASVVSANVVFNVVPDFTGLQTEWDSFVGVPVAYRTLHGGHVREVTVPESTRLAVPASSAWVYTPPGYDSTGHTRYPVIYLVHGYPGDSSNWFGLGKADLVFDELIRTQTIPPVIVVAPDVNGGPIRDGECLDARGGPQIETWLYRDLVPFIDETLPTKKDRQHRVIAGFSAGAYCALDQSLRHQPTWGAALSIEPYGEPGPVGLALLGTQSAVQAHSPSVYLPTAHLPLTTPVFLAVGSDSPTRDAQPLAAMLAERGQPVYSYTAEGFGHTWGMARDALPYGVVFASRQLRW